MTTHHTRLRRSGAFLALMITCVTLCTASVTPERWIHIDLDQKCLTLYEGVNILAKYPIASGAWDTPSPIGIFRVNRKFITQASGFGTRFLGLNVPWGNYGIHGTNRPGSIGQNASHGCIRLSTQDAEKLYPLVPYGCPVIIESGPYGQLGHHLRTLRPGDRSSHVFLVQRRLIQQGFLAGAPDGVYGENTSRAVLNARKHYHLSNEDRVDTALYHALGLTLYE